MGRWAQARKRGGGGPPLASQRCPLPQASDFLVTYNDADQIVSFTSLTDYSPAYDGWVGVVEFGGGAEDTGGRPFLDSFDLQDSSWEGFEVTVSVQFLGGACGNSALVMIGTHDF